MYSALKNVFGSLLDAALKSGELDNHSDYPRNSSTPDLFIACLYVSIKIDVAEVRKLFEKFNSNWVEYPEAILKLLYLRDLELKDTNG